MSTHCGDVINRVSLATLKQVLRRSSLLPNVLVIGGDVHGRESVAHMLHAAGTHERGAFTALHFRKGSQGPRSELLNLFRGLTRNAQNAGCRKLPLLSGGTLFIDEIEHMDLQEQRLCLEFLKQLQRKKNETPREVRLRVIAGASRDISEASARGTLIPGLLDLLDKVRVELGERPGEGVSYSRASASQTQEAVQR